MTRSLFGRPRISIAQEQRAVGLAYVAALRADWDPDATAERIVAVADRPAIAIALEAVGRSRTAHDSATVLRAEAALLRALETVRPVDNFPVAS